MRVARAPAAGGGAGGGGGRPSHRPCYRPCSWPCAGGSGAAVDMRHSTGGPGAITGGPGACAPGASYCESRACAGGLLRGPERVALPQRARTGAWSSGGAGAGWACAGGAGAGGAGAGWLGAAGRLYDPSAWQACHVERLPCGRGHRDACALRQLVTNVTSSGKFKNCSRAPLSLLNSSGGPLSSRCRRT